MFARQLDDDRFEAFLSFIQSLTEAAKMVPGILIVGSPPFARARSLTITLKCHEVAILDAELP